jgi:hypothetical protein
MIFGEIESVVNLVEKFKKFYRSSGNKTESVASRFIRLFESHGVHRNQIPRFFGHELTLKDVQDDDSLILKLDEEILEAACTLFAVKREWLDGAETRVYPIHTFYKHPEDFLAFINQLKTENPTAELSGEVIAPESEHSRYDAILVLYEVIGYVGNERICRYHLCDSWRMSYWKPRAYLTACVAIAWNAHVHIKGTYVSEKFIQRLVEGEVLFGDKNAGIDSFHGKKWYPEDMALDPELFLKDVDPERNSFGIKSGLKLWLELEEQGLMDIGMQKNARTLFEQELAKYIK